MFPNLQAELSRNNMDTHYMAVYLHITDKSMRNKMQGKSEFKLNEIEAICNLFPGLMMEYLFKRAA